MNENKLTFEEAMALLEENAEKLRSGGLSLEESVKAYEKCAEYHKLCMDILADIRQKIEVYRPENDTVGSFEE